MNQTGLLKRRKGVGSIIAGAFLVLLLLSGYTFYQINNQAQGDYQQIITTMNNEDISKNQEKIGILSYEPQINLKVNPIDPSDPLNSLEIELKVVNNGPEVIVLKYGAILLAGDIIIDEVELPSGSPISEAYTPILDEADEGITIAPSGTTYLTVTRTRLASNPFLDFKDENVNYIIHLVSEKGNVFSLRESDIPAILINDVMSSVAEVIGHFLPRYKLFDWGSLDSNGELSIPPGLVHNFVVNLNEVDKGYIFSVTGRWYGTEPITLSEDTVLKFEAIEGPAVEHMCYIVHYSSTTRIAESYNGHEIELEAFDPDSQELPNQVTLYFAAGVPGGDPSLPSENFAKNTFKEGDSFQIKIGIFDEADEYAQTFPLQVLVVTKE
jgi:hypothetical protein